MVDWGPWWFLATASYWWLRRGRLASWLDCTTRRDPTLVWPLSVDDWWGSLEQNTRLELAEHEGMDCYRIPWIFIIRFSPLRLKLRMWVTQSHWTWRIDICTGHSAVYPNWLTTILVTAVYHLLATKSVDIFRNSQWVNFQAFGKSRLFDAVCVLESLHFCVLHYCSLLWGR